MNRFELIKILRVIAEDDLREDADLFDHPCSVAIRAIDQCFDDMNALRGVINRHRTGGGRWQHSKKIEMLTGLTYNPDW